MLDQRGHREKWFRLSPQKYDQDGTVLRASHERRDEGFIELGRGAARLGVGVGVATLIALVRGEYRS